MLGKLANNQIQIQKSTDCNFRNWIQRMYPCKINLGSKRPGNIGMTPYVNSYTP